MTEKLYKTLERLRLEIDKLDIDDVESKARLEKLVADLEQKLESPDNLPNDQDLTDSLADSLTHFEVSHPTVTGILNDLMMTLSNMGI